MVKNTLQYRSQTCMHGSESIVYEIVVLQDFRFRFVSILKICRVDDDENTFLYVLQVIYNDQSDCMSSISLIMSFFTKIASVDFLEIGLTRH